MGTNWVRALSGCTWRAPIAIAAVVLLASLVPVDALLGAGGTGSIGILGVGLDKWLHVIGLCALSASLVLTTERLSWRGLVGAVLVAVAFGVAIELLQWPLPWRTASLADVLADALGAIAGGVLAWLVRVYRP